VVGSFAAGVCCCGLLETVFAPMHWRPFGFELSLAAVFVAVLSATLILVAILVAVLVPTLHPF
jgi:hypothetical protein